MFVELWVICGFGNYGIWLVVMIFLIVMVLFKVRCLSLEMVFCDALWLYYIIVYWQTSKESFPCQENASLKPRSLKCVHLTNDIGDAVCLGN